MDEEGVWKTQVKLVPYWVTVAPFSNNRTGTPKQLATMASWYKCPAERLRDVREPQYPACSLECSSEQMRAGVASSSFLMNCLLAWVSSALICSTSQTHMPTEASHWKLDVCILNMLDYYTHLPKSIHVSP